MTREQAQTHLHAEWARLKRYFPGAKVDGAALTQGCMLRVGALGAYFAPAKCILVSDAVLRGSDDFVKRTITAILIHEFVHGKAGGTGHGFRYLCAAFLPALRLGIIPALPWTAARWPGVGRSQDKAQRLRVLRRQVEMEVTS